MRSLKVIFIIVLFLACIFIGKTYYESKKEQLAFNQLIPIRVNISEKLVDNFFSNDEAQRTSARKQIKELVLKELGYNDWIEYSDYIEMLIFPINISGDNNEELLIALNISKDVSVIGIYKKHNEMYALVDMIDGLAGINNITTIKNTNLNSSFLLIEQTLDESVGAYFIDNYVQIFAPYDNNYTEVFRHSLDYTALYYEKWINPTLENPKWFKITERSVIDHISNEEDHIVIFISKTISKYEAESIDSDNIPTNFNLVEQKSFDVKYNWDDEYNAFLTGYGEIKSSNKKVGILEDTSQTVDYLLNLIDKYYKVIDKEQNVIHIDENDLIIY